MHVVAHEVSHGISAATFLMLSQEDRFACTFFVTSASFCCKLAGHLSSRVGFCRLLILSTVGYLVLLPPQERSRKDCQTQTSLSLWQMVSTNLPTMMSASFRWALSSAIRFSANLVTPKATWSASSDCASPKVTQASVLCCKACTPV